MKIKNILLSQVAPADIEKTPYAELRKKYTIEESSHGTVHPQN